MAKSFFEKLASSLNLEKDEMGPDPYAQELEEPSQDSTEIPELPIQEGEEENEDAALPEEADTLPEEENTEEETPEEQTTESQWPPQESSEAPEQLEDQPMMTQLVQSYKKPRARLALAKPDAAQATIGSGRMKISQDPTPATIGTSEKKNSGKSSAPFASIPQDQQEEEAEGQLAIDVYQTENDIVLKSTIAGVKPEDLDITIEEDMVTIKGSRKKDEEVHVGNYFYQECYWGSFSRSVILPMEIDSEQAQASFKNGVLTIRLPKLAKHKKKKITVLGE